MRHAYSLPGLLALGLTLPAFPADDRAVVQGGALLPTTPADALALFPESVTPLSAASSTALTAGRSSPPRFRRAPLPVRFHLKDCLKEASRLFIRRVRCAFSSRGQENLPARQPVTPESL
ncbi:hypothetical protein [Pantoea sp. 1.19]|uniref:hypothetical protein n=1 Tax=Pantoea sp. 1.19 TaxID=1925589 RepID=UPI0009491F8F|nr:hypothetical protein [Pantoea sp. 1.19]